MIADWTSADDVLNFEGGTFTMGVQTLLAMATIMKALLVRQLQVPLRCNGAHRC